MNLSVDLPDTSLVMVALIPSPRDLDIARLLGWYRIPLKTAPKIIAVDHLAFYQPSAFPKGDQMLIRWLAPIQIHQRLARSRRRKTSPVAGFTGKSAQKRRISCGSTSRRIDRPRYPGTVERSDQQFLTRKKALCTRSSETAQS